VVEQIQEAILGEKLTAGEILPPERELKKMFNTSRGTLREALRVLEERGLIQIKLGVGGGAVVRTVTPDHASESIGLLIRSHRVSLDHLAELRQSIEGCVTALAAQRAAAEDITGLHRLVQEGRSCAAQVRPDIAAFLEIDKRFHLEVARISVNPVCELICRTLIENMHRYFDRFLAMTPAQIQDNCRDLGDIAQAIASGRTGAARHLARHHIEQFHQQIKSERRKEQ